MSLLKNKKEKLNTLFKKVHKIYKSASKSQIIPVVLNDAQLTRKTALTLQDEGYFTLPINPPTVPVGTSRLRLSLGADMEFKEIEALLKRIDKLKTQL